jgi:hypothetical protein
MSRLSGSRKRHLCHCRFTYFLHLPQIQSGPIPRKFRKFYSSMVARKSQAGSSTHLLLLSVDAHHYQNTCAWRLLNCKSGKTPFLRLDTAKVRQRNLPAQKAPFLHFVKQLQKHGLALNWFNSCRQRFLEELLAG